MNNRKGPTVDAGTCRCCGAVKKCRLLNVEYEWTGQREVYADMFVDCFGLVVSLDLFFTSLCLADLITSTTLLK